MELAEGYDVYIAGGGDVYEQTLSMADMLRLTHVDIDIEDGTTCYPEIDSQTWSPHYRQKHDDFEFVDYIRT
jgi:dihydrofolate reductase